MSYVLVLNAGFEPLHRVSLKHAIRMIVREVAVVEEAEPGKTIGHFPVPRVLRLLRYVSMRWRHGRQVRWSKRGTLARDSRKCGYCGQKGTTIDHVLPISRGGESTWENTVACCWQCNNKKGNRTPREAGMKLKVTPKVPGWWQLEPWASTEIEYAFRV